MSASNFSLPMGRYTTCDCCHEDIAGGIEFEKPLGGLVKLCYHCVVMLGGIIKLAEEERKQRELDKALRHGQNYGMGKERFLQSPDFKIKGSQTGRIKKSQAAIKEAQRMVADSREIPDDTNHY